MKIRNTKEKREKIEIPMTPMIDIVFQLLIFFIMTFKIVAVEGDFNIKMPRGRQAASDIAVVITPMRLQMSANEAGDLIAMRLAEHDFGSGFTTPKDRSEAFSKLRSFVVRFMGNQVGPGESNSEEVEVEIDADFNLKYGYTITAITAISGRLDNSGNVAMLVEKIKLSPPRGNSNAG